MRGDDSETPRPSTATADHGTAGGQAGLFAAASAQDSGAGRMLAAVVVAGVVAVFAVSMARAVDSSRRMHDASLVSGQAAHMGPLELTSLTHRRDGETWTVGGRFRTPEARHVLEPVTVVTFLFDHDGVFVASGRTVVDVSAMERGRESDFRIDVMAEARIARYRVSFRATDGAVIPHYDRRLRSDDDRRPTLAGPSALARLARTSR